MGAYGIALESTHAGKQNNDHLEGVVRHHARRDLLADEEGREDQQVADERERVGRAVGVRRRGRVEQDRRESQERGDREAEPGVSEEHEEALVSEGGG